MTTEMSVAEYILDKACAIVAGSHFVYKAGTHGPAYINKDALLDLDASTVIQLIQNVGKRALDLGLQFRSERIVVLTPAYGAIPYGVTLADRLSMHRACLGRSVSVSRTEVREDATGKRIHFIPEKLQHLLAGADVLLLEDIVNNGTTIREVAKLVRAIPDADLIGAVCIADRGEQTAEMLGIKQYYPLLRVEMEQYEADDCPLCQQGIAINARLGKGKRWVELFGQPPYRSGMDFSKFRE